MSAEAVACGDMAECHRLSVRRVWFGAGRYSTAMCAGENLANEEKAHIE